MPRRLAVFSWGVLAYNVLVVLWGAYVRATGSGAGCGSHWPLCQGEVVPRAPHMATLIEFTHRVTSGAALLLVAALVWWVFRALPRRHPARRGAVLASVLIVIEALLGAALVLFQWVASNASAARAVSLSVHLANTLALLGALALTAWWVSGGPPVNLSGGFRRIAGLALGAMVMTGASGAVVALGDTLFPASSLAAGLRDDIAAAHFLVRLRVAHPVLAMLAAGFAMFAALRLLQANSAARPWAVYTIWLVLGQMVVGLMNVLLMAPVWLQLTHLLLADLLWIALVLACAAGMGAAPQRPDE